MQRQLCRTLAGVLVAASVVATAVHVEASVPGLKTRLGPNYRSAAWKNTPIGGVLDRALARLYGGEQIPELNGQGQTIAVVGAYHDAAADVKAGLAQAIADLRLAPMYGVPGAAPCTIQAGPHPCLEVTHVDPDSRKENLIVGDTSAYAENNLSVQAAHKSAPGADIRVYLAASMSVFDVGKALREAVSAEEIVSLSYGTDEAYLLASAEFGSAYIEAQEAAFRHGQALVVAASGDDPALKYPATSPQVLAVGGTTFMNGHRLVPLQYEAASSPTPGRTHGSAGGYSGYFARPSHQDGFHSGSHRAVPDLVMSADGQSVAVDGRWGSFGGTSAAAPLVAGVVARINQARALAGQPPVRTPGEFYAAARRSSAAAPVFKDITRGYASCAPGTDCAARAGFDLATGLGAPRMENLIPQMAGLGRIEIGDIQVTGVGATSAEVTFTTGLPASASVCYGPARIPANVLEPVGPFADCVTTTATPQGRHRATLTLQPDRNYQFVVQARSADYLARAEGSTFKTRALALPECVATNCATALRSGQAVAASLPTFGRSTYLKFDAQAGATMRVEAVTSGSGWVQIAIYEPGRTHPTYQVLQGRDGRGRPLTAPAYPVRITGTYYVQLSNWGPAQDVSVQLTH